MKSVSLSIVAVLLLAVSFGSADIVQNFLVSRDGGNDQNNYANAGAAGQVRGAKNPWDEDTSYYDWNTEDIDTWIDTNGGRANVLSIDFFLKPVTCPGVGTTIGIQVFGLHSNNDWVEGAGTSIWTSYNWPEGAPAATYQYAQTYWTLVGTTKTLDTVNSVRWNNGSNVSLGSTSLRGIRNSLDWDPGDVNNTYYSVALDTAFWTDMLDNEKNRGIILWDENNIPGDENWEAYMRESAAGANAAYLQVTIVPEPVTMALVTMGAVSVLLKRRRRV